VKSRECGEPSAAQDLKPEKFYRLCAKAKGAMSVAGFSVASGILDADFGWRSASVCA